MGGAALPAGTQLGWQAAEGLDFGPGGRGRKAAADWTVEQLRLRNLAASERSPALVDALFDALQQQLPGALKARSDPLPLGGSREVLLARLLAVLAAEREIETAQGDI